MDQKSAEWTCDEVHARIIESRVALSAAIANSRSLKGSRAMTDVYRALVDADRLLKNIALPWTAGNS